MALDKTGTNGNDTLIGGDGNDTLNGAGGHDLIDGGGGRDYLIGGAGNDRMFGRAGNDAMSGNSGNDRLDGGDGNDRLFGQTGNDLLFGGDGNDLIDGGAGNDRLAGGAGDDTLIGTGGGTDTFEGSTGNDTMILGATLPALVDGGTGIDRANLDALGSSIDLSGPLADRFDDLEILDLGGGKANTLSLSAASVVTMAGGGGAFPDGALLVKGDAGDSVDLDGTWTKGAPVSNPFGEAGSYISYTNGAAQVLVESELAVITGPMPPNTVDLGTLDGTNGFTVIGADAGDGSGTSVSSAGDVNGDGFDDLLIGAPGAESPGGANGEGETYVVFGKANWLGAPAIDLATLDGTNGFRVTGLDAGDGSGVSVSSAGDINGDGFSDIVIGAPYADMYDSPSFPAGGEVYVVLGKANWATTPSVDIATLDGTNGFRFDTFEEGDNTGRSVSAAGDVNGDGFDDFIFGAPVAGVFLEGRSYVVFGGESGISGTATIIGADLEEFSGTSVSSAGDVNGDGFADLIIGTPVRPYGYGSAGETFVVFGNSNLGSIDLSTIDGTNGFSLVGIDPNDFSGRSVSGAGDINGDGFADLIIGARDAEGAGGGDSEGESYVVFGKASWAGTPSLDLAALNGANGFRLIGADAGDQGGFSVSAAGDLNGDGLGDLIVGAPNADATGASYVVYGKADWTGTPALDLAALDGTNGFRLAGVDGGDLSGRSVSDAGDVNGDGFDDLIVGAPGATGPGGAVGEGESYVVFGGNFTGAVTHLGDAGANTLTGTAAAESFVGGGGDDTMRGNGGADSFQGGGGNDTMSVGAEVPLYVNGGSGIDIVNLDARGPQINLAGLDGGRFVEIEKIDLGGANANTLLLDAQAVTNMTGANGNAFDDNTLLVKGDAGDSVNLAGTWTKGGTLINPLGESGSYTEYTSTTGQARILVESDLAVVAGAAASIDLASLDGSTGFRLVGIDAGDGIGFSVASAGDVNGDGFVDLIVGAPAAEGPGGPLSEGETYVVFGKDSWVGTPALDLASLDGTNGFRLVGLDGSDQSGWSVSSAGDINGDGFADVIIGAPDVGDYDPEVGEAYLVFGKADWIGSPSVDLASLDGENGVRLEGTGFFDSLGVSVSRAGDVNGDGFDDFIIGANDVGLDPYGSGQAYVVFGKEDWASTFRPAFVDGTTGFSIRSSGAEDTGFSVSTAGDVNGDGFADLIVGAPDGFFGTEPYGPGESYIVFGKANWTGTPSINSADLDGTNGFQFFGTNEFDRAGWAVSTAGDLNGDGFADLIVTAVSAESAGGPSGEGQTYVVFGKADWSGTPIVDRADLDGTTGFLMAGANATTSAGDVNGDGYDDFIVGVASAESAGGETNEGVSYLVYGKADWSGTPEFDFTDLDGTNGFRLVGADENDFSGRDVSSAGDVNGDGFDDLLIGATSAESPGGAASEGETYVVFGGNFNGAVTHLGGIGDDTLNGTAAAENFVGGTGDDVMNGKGGADAFQGGQGDDELKVASLDFFIADGGTGFDTLALDGSNLDLDLTALADSRTRSIEHLDITGTGNNTLTLSIADVLSLSDESNEVRVSGNAGDAVDIGAGWTTAASGGTNGNGTSTIDGQTYQIYTAGQASLLVDTDVTASV